MNALWLMLGTLTAIRVPAPSRVDRRVAGWAMALAPLGGLVLALPTVVALAVLAREDVPLSWSPLVQSVLVLGALALLTRGMHLDGLADTADGLGSGRRGETALTVMKQSDIGPFGVVTLLLTLLLQAACLVQAITHGAGPLLLLVALVVSRGVLPVVCARWFPAARSDGLGRTVSQSVGTAHLVGSLVVTVAIVVGACLASTSSTSYGGPALMLGVDQALLLALAALGGMVVGVLMAVRAARRFGGVTGDVYGAAVEVTFTATLLFALLPL